MEANCNKILREHHLFLELKSHLAAGSVFPLRPLCADVISRGAGRHVYRQPSADKTREIERPSSGSTRPCTTDSKLWTEHRYAPFVLRSDHRGLLLETWIKHGRSSPPVHKIFRFVRFQPENLKTKCLKVASGVVLCFMKFNSQGE